MSFSTPSPKSRMSMIATAATVVGVLALPSVANASLEAQDAGNYCVEGTNTTSRSVAGLACFFPFNGKLTVYDKARDGHGAHAQLVYGTSNATVADPDGAKSGHGEKTVKVPKGQVPHLRLCVTGLGCTTYKIPHDI